MDSAVKDPKDDEDPRRCQVRRIDLAGDEQVERQRVEEDRDLEEVLEVVGWVRHLRR